MESELIERLKKRSTKSELFMKNAVPIEAELIIHPNGDVTVASILWENKELMLRFYDDENYVSMAEISVRLP